MKQVSLPVFGGVSLLAVAGLVFGVLEWQTAADAERVAQAAEAHRQQQETELAEALANLQKLQGEWSEAQVALERLRKERESLQNQAKALAQQAAEHAGVVEAPSGGSPKMDLRAVAAGFMRSLDDPQMRKAMRERGVRDVTNFYDKVFKQLGLSERDTQVVAGLLSERNLAALEKGRALFETNAADPEAMAKVREEIKATKAEYDAKIRGVVGGPHFDEIANFEETAGDQRTVDRFSRNLQRQESSLEPPQIESLTAIMREERLKNPTNELPDMGGGPNPNLLLTDAEATARQTQEEDYQSRVLARASQAGLNPDQVNSLQDSFKERNEQQVMSRAMGRVFLGGGRPTPPPAPTGSKAP